MVSPAMTRSISAGPVCTAAARTGGAGHPRCPKRSMNTGLGETLPSARRISVDVKLMTGVTTLKSER